MRYLANAFDTEAEAKAFKSGVLYVNDSSIKSVEIEYNRDSREWEVIVDDTDRKDNDESQES